MKTNFSDNIPADENKDALDRYIIVRHVLNNKAEHYVFFPNDESQKIGAGKQGKVVKAYKINDAGNINTTDQEYIVKITHPIQNYNTEQGGVFEIPQDMFKTIEEQAIKEARLLNRKSIKTTPGFKISNGQMGFITQYIKGLDLCDGEGSLLPQFKNLDLKHRLKLMMSIALSFNLLHHHTASTGNAIMHNDVKGQNIRVAFHLRKKDDSKFRHLIDFRKENNILVPIPNECFKYENEKITPADGYELILDVYPMDFGMSEEITHEDYLQKTNPGGTLDHRAPEIFVGEAGVKSDVFSLSPIFIALLGGTNPFTSRNDVSMDEKYKPFCLDGICNSPEFDLLEKNIKKVVIDCIRKFINLIQNENYHSRPDTDVVFLFFQRLNAFLQESGCFNKKASNNNVVNNSEKEVLDGYLKDLGKLANGEELAEVFVKYEDEPTTKQLNKNIDEQVANSPKTLFIKELNRYIISRYNEASPKVLLNDSTIVDFFDDNDELKNLSNYRHFWGSLFGAQDARVKITAALKLKNHFNPKITNKPKFTDEELKALLKSKLGEIVKKSKLIWPDSFKDQIIKFNEKRKQTQ